MNTSKTLVSVAMFMFYAMKLIFVVLIVVIVDSLCISVDYFLGNKEPETEQKIENDTESKTLKHSLFHKMLRKHMNNSLTENITMIYNETSDYYDEIELSEIEEKMLKKSGKSKIYQTHDGTDYRSEDEQIGYDTRTILRQNNNVSFAKELKFLLQDYMYNDEKLSTSPQPLLRFKSFENENRVAFDAKKIVIKNITEEEEKMPIDFYNISPAANINDANDVFPFTTGRKHVWYVQESATCWELPIIYAELERALGPTDVFLTFRGTLKNVIEAPEKPSQPSRPLYIPVSQTLNKWCAAGPCYGDHTLCLFSDKTYAKLCETDYTVSTPTMVEQIALVNTINSMRNGIANGGTELYSHLPKAADMNQVIYDFDLQSMAEAWLHQCLPGPSACSALDGNYVTQLECTKYAKYCCIDSYKTEKASKCIPLYECFVEPILGCIHVWFWSAGKMLTKTDVQCGHITPYTYSTAQLLWADTNKVGCAYGKGPEGDIRVVCNFAPGARFYIDTNYYCGFIAHKDFMENFTENITDPDFLDSLGINLNPVNIVENIESQSSSHHINYSLRYADIDVLAKIYKKKWIRQIIQNSSNGTLGLIARLVTRYTFVEDGGSQCDMNEAIYDKGEPGSKCIERGRRFHGLCYDYRDPTPGYRLVAVLAPVALFSLILYDLFSGVVRQTNY